ncbi:MAG TPA: hypothetical protein VIV60_19245 [Polyangiaceae bacterium]
MGYRIATNKLDSAVLEAIANVVCSNERASALAMKWHCDAEQLRQAWRAILTTDPDVVRAYVLHLIEYVEVHEPNIVVTPKRGGRMIASERLLTETK